MRQRKPEPESGLGPGPETKNGIRIGAITSWACLPKSGVVLILGYQGGGKSALAWALIEEAREGRMPGHRIQGGLRRPVVMLRMPAKARGLLPSYVRSLAEVSDLKRIRGAYVFIDEASKNANARRAMSGENLEIVEANAISRQNGHLIFYVAQHSRQPDIDVVTSAALVLHKMPSLLHLRFARPELRTELELARDVFLPMTEKDRKRHTVVIDYREGASGTLTNRLPSFWSDNLSVAFAGVPPQATAGPAGPLQQRQAKTGRKLRIIK